MSTKLLRRLLVVTLLTSGIGLGCTTTRIENAPLPQFQAGTGYGHAFAELQHSDELRVVLAFSGGGTRAAALAYGVLKELRDTKVALGGAERRVLDQVSTISSVSGGSFTSAYYGLHGERIFEDYEEKFLRRDFNAMLTVNLLRPLKMLRIALTPYSRSDMAADLYDRKLFEGATFADLERSAGPTLNINATDIDVGGVFTFIQPVFDTICSDLSQLRVSKAVTASSAVPGIFSPLLLKNKAGSCGYSEPGWIKQALANPTASRRRYHNARVAATYFDAEERPYVFLVDGGVADNIGARRLLADVIDAGSVENLAKTKQVDVPKNILYIIVNAQAGGQHSWDRQARSPGLPDILSTISGTGMYRYNFETVELLRESVADWSRGLAKQGHQLNAYVAEVAFDDLADHDERAFFNDVKTSFTLDDKTIDRLIEVGGRLLRETPEFQEFLKDMKK